MSVPAGACASTGIGDLRESLARARRAVADAAVALGSVDPSLLGPDVLAVSELRCTVEALDAEVLAGFDRARRLGRRRRPLHPRLAHRAHHSRTRAVRRPVRAADRARDLPVMAAAWAHGQVTGEHLRVLADAHRHYPALSAALTAIEPAITAYAATVDPPTLHRFLLDRLHRIDPTAVDAADQDRVRRQAGVKVAALLDGWGRVEMTLPPEVFALLRALLDAAATAVRRDGSPGDANGCDPRPLSARQLDAFRRVLAAAAAAQGAERLPDVRGARPQIVRHDHRRHPPGRPGLPRRRTRTPRRPRRPAPGADHRPHRPPPGLRCGGPPRAAVGRRRRPRRRAHDPGHLPRPAPGHHPPRRRALPIPALRQPHRRDPPHPTLGGRRSNGPLQPGRAVLVAPQPRAPRRLDHHRRPRPPAPGSPPGRRRTSTSRAGPATGPRTRVPIPHRCGGGVGCRHYVLRAPPPRLPRRGLDRPPRRGASSYAGPARADDPRKEPDREHPAALSNAMAALRRLPARSPARPDVAVPNHHPRAALVRGGPA